MVTQVEGAMRSFSRAEHAALVEGLMVAVTSESAFLADPSGAVWTPMCAVDRRDSLLQPQGAADIEPA